MGFLSFGGVQLIIMARQKRTYRRMPGRPFTPFVVGSLWQGPDHLLFVESVFFKEQNKRFYYDDIQSIVLQRTGTHLLWTFAWGALALLFGIIALLASGPGYVSGTFCSIFLIALLVNILKGPTCLVYFQTAVQIQKITSLKRVRTANKVMTRIRALVEERQGAWEKQKSIDIRQKALHAAQSAETEAPITSAVQKQKEEPRGRFKPLLHQILFGLILSMGIVWAIQILLKSPLIGLLETLLHAAALIISIVALARWFRHLKGSMIAKLNWLALIFLVILTIVGYGIYFAALFRNPEMNYHHWAMFKLMFEIQMSDHPMALAGNIIYAGGCLLIGGFGLVAVQRQWK